MEKKREKKCGDVTFFYFNISPPFNVMRFFHPKVISKFVLNKHIRLSNLFSKKLTNDVTSLVNSLKF